MTVYATHTHTQRERDKITQKKKKKRRGYQVAVELELPQPALQVRHLLDVLVLEHVLRADEENSTVAVHNPFLGREMPRKKKKNLNDFGGLSIGLAVEADGAEDGGKLSAGLVRLPDRYLPIVVDVNDPVRHCQGTQQQRSPREGVGGQKEVYRGTRRCNGIEMKQREAIDGNEADVRSSFSSSVPRLIMDSARTT
jgi:hypothetical protein